MTAVLLFLALVVVALFVVAAAMGAAPKEPDTKRRGWGEWR